jgi:hypothetical protein
VAWFNTQRLLEPIGHIPPAEAEANYYQLPVLSHAVAGWCDLNQTASTKDAGRFRVTMAPKRVMALPISIERSLVRLLATARERPG